VTVQPPLHPRHADPLDAASRLMLAVDFPAVRDAEAFVAAIGAPPIVYKIGLELIYAGGLGLASSLIGQGQSVFIDAKLLDIGHTVERSVANIARLGASFVTVHASDRKTLKAAVNGRGASPLKLLAVTVLTNLEAQDLAEQGITAALAELVMRRARMALEAGFDGVVASGAEASSLRDALGPDFLIVTPGIRPAGADRGDQARVMTPGDAIRAGADYLVVGRPVTRAHNPRAALDSIIAEIKAALQP